MAEKKTETWEATGRRKSSTARVRLRPGSGRMSINGREAAEFLRREALMQYMHQPLVLTETADQLDIQVTVEGGGLTGVAGAIRHGISRALCDYNPEFRTPLKRAGMLTRDSRVKERKKYGLKGARARFQFSKR
jgi:small subunit ribosomal protein S9